MSSKESAAYICEHIFEGTHPVLLVAHDDGDWQFLCGGHHEPGELPRVVGLDHILDADPSINDVLDLPVNWEAERDSPDGEWVRTPSSSGT